MGLRSKWGSTALRAGATWHGFLEGFYLGIKEFGWENREKAIVMAIERGKKVWDAETNGYNYFDDYRTFDAVSTMFIDYIQHYQMDENMLEVIDVEQIFEVPIELTDDELVQYGYLPPITFTGRIDLVIKLSGSIWAKEHKTTGMSLDIMANQLNKSAQIMGYSYAAPLYLPYQISGFLVSFAYWASRKNKDGVYGKLTTDFKRIPQIFNQGDLYSWRDAFIYECSLIYNCFVEDYFPMNHDSCYAWGKACSYKPLCDLNIPPKELDWEENYVYAPWDVRNEGVE